MLLNKLLFTLLITLAASVTLADAAACREISPNHTKNRTSPEHQRIVRQLFYDHYNYSTKVNALIESLQPDDLCLTHLFLAQELQTKIHNKFHDLTRCLDFAVLKYLTQYAKKYAPKNEQVLFVQSMFYEYKKRDIANRQNCEQRVDALTTKLFLDVSFETFTTELLMEAMVLRFTLLSHDHLDLVTELDLYVQRAIASYASNSISVKKQKRYVDRTYNTYRTFYKP